MDIKTIKKRRKKVHGNTEANKEKWTKTLRKRWTKSSWKHKDIQGRETIITLQKKEGKKFMETLRQTRKKLNKNTKRKINNEKSS